MIEIPKDRWPLVLAELIHDLEELQMVLNLLKRTDNATNARIVAVAATQVQLAKAILKSEIEAE